MGFAIASWVSLVKYDTPYMYTNLSCICILTVGLVILQPVGQNTE